MSKRYFYNLHSAKPATKKQKMVGSAQYVTEVYDESQNSGIRITLYEASVEQHSALNKDTSLLLA